MGKIFKALEKSESETEKKTVLKKYNTSAATVKKEQVRPEFKKPVIETDPPKNKQKGPEGFYAATSKANRNLVSVLKPHSIESEQFRVLKNSLLFPESGRPPRTVMVTSTSQGEGKSFVASNLAAAIAYSIDEYVLLADCDLRHPTIHTMFGVENNGGLSTYLTKGVPLSSVLKKTFLQKLTILPGGTPPANPSELISSEQMRRMIKEVENRYDDRYVILDAPPPYITSEANALAKYVDGVVIVVKYGQTRKDRLQDIIDIYGKDRILGVVKNFAKGKFGLSYGYKYKYGYSQKG